MDAFVKGKYQDAFNIVKPYTAIEGYQLDTLASTTPKHIENLSGSFGKVLSYEQVVDKEVKNSLIKLMYLVKFEKSYLRLCFILYNNGTGWTIINLKYDSEADDVF